jgi:hypothetical protein
LLKNPADYLLLAVRAAVAGGASEVKITLNYERVHLEFSLDDQSLSEMMDGFVRAEDERSRAAQILHFSLGGAFDQDVSKVDIAWPGWRLIADGQTLKGEATEGRPGVLSMAFDRSGLGLLARRKRTAQEHRAIFLRCAYASIPVSLDGHRLSGGEATIAELAQGKSGLPDGLMLAEAFLRFGEDKLDKRPSRRPVAIVFQKPRYKRNESWDALPGSVFLRIIEPDSGAYFHLSRLYGKGELQVVKDGVCLEPIEASTWLPGSRMVVRAENIETDLTQLRPRDSEELLALREWATEQNLKICKLLSAQNPHMRGPHPVHKKMKSSLAAGGMGLLFGAVGGPASALVMGGLSLFLGLALLSPVEDGFRERIEGYLSKFCRLHPSEPAAVKDPTKRPDP